MPVYNAEKYVARSIESILNQSAQNFELIIVNDGSTDRTGDILSRYLQDSRIKYHSFDRNRGYASACNKGVEKAAGDFLAMQDADDISLPTRLEEEIKTLEANPEVELVYSPVFFINAVEEVTGRWGGKGRQLSKEEAFYELYLNGDFIPNPSIMIRRRHIQDMLYDPQFPVCNDLDHKLRVTHDYPILEVPYPLVKMRHGDGHKSLTAQRELNFLAERQILRSIYMRYRRSHPEVKRTIYLRAVSQQLLKESQYHAEQRQSKSAICKLVQAAAYYPLHLRSYGSIVGTLFTKLIGSRGAL